MSSPENTLPLSSNRIIRQLMSNPSSEALRVKKLLNVALSPIENLSVATQDLQQLSKSHIAFEQNLKVANVSERAIIYSQFASSLLNASLSSAAVMRYALDAIKKGCHNLEHFNPIATPLMAWAGIFVSVSLTLSDIKQYQKKSFKLNEMHHLLSELEAEFINLYADYSQYLGHKKDISQSSHHENLIQIKEKIEKDRTLNELIVSLQSRCLHTLIQQQAYIMFNDNDQLSVSAHLKGFFHKEGTKKYSLLNIYQMAIEKKIQSLSQTEIFKNNHHQKNLLRQYVIGLQHQAQYQMALPLLKKHQNHTALRIGLGIVLLGLAVAITVVSVGVLSPCVGGALIAVSGILKNIQQYHKNVIAKKEQKIEKHLTPVARQLKLFSRTKGTQHQSNIFTSPINAYQSYQALLNRLISIVSSTNDNLSSPLKAYFSSSTFKKLIADEAYTEALYQIKCKVSQIKDAASRWDRFALSQHELYLLIEEIDLDDIKEARKKISQYEMNHLTLDHLKHGDVETNEEHYPSLSLN